MLTDQKDWEQKELGRFKSPGQAQRFLAAMEPTTGCRFRLQYEFVWKPLPIWNTIDAA